MFRLILSHLQAERVETFRPKIAFYVIKLLFYLTNTLYFACTDRHSGMTDVKTISYRPLYVCVELFHIRIYAEILMFLLTVHLSIIFAFDQLNT